MVRAGAAPALVTERLRPAQNSAPRPEGPLHCSLLRFSVFLSQGPLIFILPQASSAGSVIAPS